MLESFPRQCALPHPERAARDAAPPVKENNVIRMLLHPFAATMICLAPALCCARQAACEPDSAIRVAALSALPASLQTALAKGSPGGKIADTAEAFNATDLRYPNIPDQRFRAAMLGQHCAVIEVERGGSQRADIAIVFERNGDTWEERLRTVTPSSWTRRPVQ